MKRHDSVLECDRLADTKASTASDALWGNRDDAAVAFLGQFVSEDEYAECSRNLQEFFDILREWKDAEEFGEENGRS